MPSRKPRAPGLSQKLMRAIVLFFVWAFCSALNGAESGRTFVITCPAKVSKQGNVENLIISDGQQRFEFPWLSFREVKGLRKNQIYTFILVEEQSSWGDNFTAHNLTKIERKGKAIYDREICSIHKVKMERKKVPVVYGYITHQLDAPSSRITERLFPNRYEARMGGCVFTPGFSPEIELVYVCSECKDAFEKWEAEDIKDLMVLEQRDFGVVRSISLESDGTYVEIRHPLYICSNLGGLEGGIAVAMGRYRFQDRGSRLLLISDSESDDASELYRAKYWGREYWVPKHDRAQISRFRESSLRRSSLRVVR